MKKRALILTWDGFQDQEVIYPYYRVQEDGFTVDVLGPEKDRPVTGLFGIKFNTTVTPSDLLYWNGNGGGFTGQMVYNNNWDLLIIPGGVKALEKLRQENKVLQFIDNWNSQGRIISSTCHGAQMMISAKIVSGRKISGYYSIKDDINNAGATYVDQPAVVDKNIISSPHYKHMGEWMKVTLEEYYKLFYVGGLPEQNSN